MKSNEKKNVEQVPVEVTPIAETETCFTIVRQEGGYKLIQVEAPLSSFVVLSEPDVLAITLSKLEMAMLKKLDL